MYREIRSTTVALQVLNSSLPIHENFEIQKSRSALSSNVTKSTGSNI